MAGGPKALASASDVNEDSPEIGQRDIVVCAVSTSSPRLGCLYQITPVVRSSTGPGKELIDALLCGLGVL